MASSITESKNTVEKFIEDLVFILESPTFNIDEDLDILMKKSNEDKCDPKTTENTLLALDYDRYDVKEHLRSLKVNEYIETLIDSKDAQLPPFYVFGRNIEGNDVYIKVKIRDKINQKVFCISFHFARYPFRRPFPYEF